MASLNWPQVYHLRMKLAAFIFLVAMIGACGGEANPVTPNVTAAPSPVIQATAISTPDVAATVPTDRVTAHLPHTPAMRWVRSAHGLGESTTFPTFWHAERTASGPETQNPKQAAGRSQEANPDEPAGLDTKVHKNQKPTEESTQDVGYSALRGGHIALLLLACVKPSQPQPMPL
jgi:hypothetical protein